MNHRRILVPAAWFYEWNKNKEKNTFYRKASQCFIWADLYNRYQEEERFVSLTTTANDSKKTVHDRMLLLLDRDEI